MGKKPVIDPKEKCGEASEHVGKWPLPVPSSTAQTWKRALDMNQGQAVLVKAEVGAGVPELRKGWVGSSDCSD